ncbi:MAG TPA: histone deacetylase [Dehalococcoidia bacterium]|nr:histone deacetylase [Dehalococcoidia bacterium]
MSEPSRRRVGLLRDARFQDHDTTANHPEHPERLVAIERLLGEARLVEACLPLESRAATDAELLRAHDPALLEMLARSDQFAQAKRVFIDPDTVMSGRSLEVARHAAGGVIDAARLVATGELDGVFCLPRPPGHHATRSQAMGFCLINHIAVAAADLLASGMVARAAIIDFDVHHGNGTQDIFYGDPRVLYVSTHQSPHYPGTGAVDEVGDGTAPGTTLNLPLPAGSGDLEYLRCFDEVILPVVRRYDPSIILVSAGFDAHWRDPLAGQRVSGAGYRAIAERLDVLAEELGVGVAYVLEGGYDLEAIAWAARHCLDVQLGNDWAEDAVGPAPSGAGADLDSLLGTVRHIHRL